MGYTPTNWQTGDTVTAEKLNKIETGISNACIAGAIKIKYSGFSSATHDGGLICHAFKNEFNNWDCYGLENVTYTNLYVVGNPTFAVPVNIVNTEDITTWLVFVAENEPDIAVLKTENGTSEQWTELNFGSTTCWGVQITDLTPLHLIAL